MLRRSLRDYQRHEYTRIFQLERRARGLRLYAAWTQKTEAIPIWETPQNLPLPITGAFHDNVRLPPDGRWRQSQLVPPGKLSLAVSIRAQDTLQTSKT